TNDGTRLSAAAESAGAAASTATSATSPASAATAAICGWPDAREDDINSTIIPTKILITAATALATISIVLIVTAAAAATTAAALAALLLLSLLPLLSLLLRRRQWNCRDIHCGHLAAHTHHLNRPKNKIHASHFLSWRQIDGDGIFRVKAPGIVCRSIGFLDGGRRGRRADRARHLGQTQLLRNPCYVLGRLTSAASRSAGDRTDEVIAGAQPIKTVRALIVGQNLSFGNESLCSVLILIGQRLNLYSGNRFSGFIAYLAGDSPRRNHRNIDCRQFLSGDYRQRCPGTGDPGSLTIFLSNKSIAI